MDYRWLLVHILPTVGFVLALILLAHILREKRPPTSTLAWLMAIVFIPYAGVPLYLVFGGRKMLSRADAKPALETAKGAPSTAPDSGGVRLLAPDGGVFPASANNRITLLPEGAQAFENILGLIRGASRFIPVATFILGKDETGRAIVEALALKASQGVEVRLLLDALGSVKISRKYLSPLLSAGGQAAYFMPMIHLPFRGRANLRNHRKMLVCDGEAAVIGGMNLASEYMGPRDFPGRWRDLSLLVEGPVVDDIAGIFRSDWRFASKTPLPVLGVPVQSKALNGMDSLLSIVQMPAGIPVGTLAIGKAGAVNAAILAASMLGNKYPAIRAALVAYRQQQTDTVLAQPDPRNAS